LPNKQIENDSNFEMTPPEVPIESVSLTNNTKQNFTDNHVRSECEDELPQEVPIQLDISQNANVATPTLISNISNEPNSTQSVNEDQSLIDTSMTDESNKELITGDLQTFYNLKSKNFKNPCIAYLNINSLRGDKFTQLKEMVSFVKPEILCIDETKLTSDFPRAQFHIDGYNYPPFRRDRPQRI